MCTQYQRSWVLLTSLAGWAAIATALEFAVEPLALMQLARADDAQDVSGREVQSQSQDAAQSGESVQTVYLIKLLEGSSQFRVRAQAAISLGMMEKSAAARAALTAALRDVHPAVRAAAATSLGRIGDANHVVALRTLGSDSEEPVRNAARASIGKLENMLAKAAVSLETAVTSAAFSNTASPQRL